MNGKIIIVTVYFDEAYTKALKEDNPFKSEIEEIEQQTFYTKDGKEIYHAVSRMAVERSNWIEVCETLTKYTNMHFGDGTVVLVYNEDIIGIPVEPMIMFICDDGEQKVTEITIKKGANV